MKRLGAVLLIAAIATPAHAETSAQRAACTPDVWRHCASEIPNVGAIKSCLRRERVKLSAACRMVMDEADNAKLVSRPVALSRN
ncbi:hypothetical protein [Methylobacterium dankookense]|uniref:Cysteine rich repeat protein n=1 Tax=Methylobacterium dankookense TaxID=560405 RepID=A0A564FTD9_9HYPH|nr:hypothetical protein [Methylobacterium dankookense]GJD55998.1 hypothetical protein IFDJLNFL_1890 [Methylobacterium dankookense]VUF11409.1 hypothetical protein MTDSW087_01091 [Methylobacterium dankookense]